MFTVPNGILSKLTDCKTSHCIHVIFEHLGVEILFYFTYTCKINGVKRRCHSTYNCKTFWSYLPIPHFGRRLTVLSTRKQPPLQITFPDDCFSMCSVTSKKLVVGGRDAYDTLRIN